jgi:hypothetical protein
MSSAVNELGTIVNGGSSRTGRQVPGVLPERAARNKDHQFGKSKARPLPSARIARRLPGEGNGKDRLISPQNVLPLEDEFRDF